MTAPREARPDANDLHGPATVGYWRARCMRCEAERELDEFFGMRRCSHPLDPWIAGVLAIIGGFVGAVALFWWLAR